MNLHEIKTPEGAKRDTKRIGRGQKFELTDDPVADTKRIQEIYEAMHLQGKHRENYATHL